VRYLIGARRTETAKERAMASKSTPKRRQIQVFVRAQLDEAQRRLSTFESDAEKMLKGFLAQGREQRRQLETRVLSRVVEAVGVASQAQIRELTRELSRISKKVDALVGKRAARG
jgi:hypothetical protein